jgi:hypothetical protein
MKELEDELHNPTGIHTVSPPGLSIDGILVSKECGVLYKISNTEGLRSVLRILRRPCVSTNQKLRSVAFLRKVATCEPSWHLTQVLFTLTLITDAGLAALSYLFMLFLFVRQAKLSRTASGILRVSRWTFLAQTTMDCVSFAGHITFAILAEGRTSLSLVAPAFLACILFASQAVSQLSIRFTYR